MKKFLKNKSIGFYFLLLAVILACISTVRFLIWAPKHNSMDSLIMIALLVGIVLNIILFVKDSEYVVILTTVCYSIAAIKLLTDSVGSFVDAFQGINMFGDAKQVGTILTTSIIILGSVLMSIVASFLKRVKE